tara:strand:- start:4313 stop:4504 length:192 start_codon:yes stop_codon:yes gene_type:complete
VQETAQKRKQDMRAQRTPLGRLGDAVKLPFNIFADEEDKVLMRLDEMHKSVPDQLPAKGFFRH